MTKRLFSVLLAGALSATVFAGAAQAADRGKGKGHGFEMRHGGGRDLDREDRVFRHADRDRDRDRDNRDNVFARRNGLGPSSRPPGWSHGRKTGWGNCDLPPGLAKKEGCNSLFGGRTGRIRRHNGDRGNDNDRDDLTRGSAPLGGRVFPTAPVRDEDRAPNPRSIFHR